MKVQSMVYRQWRHHLHHSGFLHSAVILLLCMLALLLSGCNGLFQVPAQSGTPGANGTVHLSVPTSTVSPTATTTAVLPTITLQVVGCPSTLSLNWDKLVGTQANVNKVQKVICGSLERTGTLDALVDVRYYSSNSRLDFSVYDDLFGTPTRRLNVSGLLRGDAAISSVSTIITAEVNPGDVIQGPPDLFKEYQWNGAAFVQVPYPAIYPDVTRYQAEHAQALVSSELAALPATQIHDYWRLTAGGVVSHLVQSIFHWSAAEFSVALPAHASRLSILPVTVTNLGPGGGGFIATLHHLNDVPTNIFEVYTVTSINGGSTLNSPSVYTRLASPVTVSGASVASGSVLGQVVLYDDMYINVGSSGPIHSSASSGYVSFTNSVSYHLGIHGVEEGVIVFYATSQNNAALSNQVVMMKVFLSA